MKSTTLAILSVLVIAFSHVTLSEVAFRCDYEDVGDAWLKLHRKPTTWGDAKATCQFEGAVLASPVPNKLRDDMKSKLQREGIETAIFTGINSLYSNSYFVTITGDPISRINVPWAKNQPDNFNNRERCVVLLPEGTLADVKCDEPYPYICYRKKSQIVVNNCGTIDPDYNLDTRTGSCYKFHTKPVTWTYAYMACAAEGGYLAVINSEVESTVLKELYARYPEDTIKLKYWNDVAFIGFQFWNETGEFETVFGQTIKEAGFDTFGNGQPDNGPPGKQPEENCGGLWRNGLLDDAWCWKKQPFICEKDPKSLRC